MEEITLAAVSAAIAFCMVHFLWQGYKALQRTLESIKEAPHDDLSPQSALNGESRVDQSQNARENAEASENNKVSDHLKKQIEEMQLQISQLMLLHTNAANEKKQKAIDDHEARTSRDTLNKHVEKISLKLNDHVSELSRRMDSACEKITELEGNTGKGSHTQSQQKSESEEAMSKIREESAEHSRHLAELQQDVGFLKLCQSEQRSPSLEEKVEKIQQHVDRWTKQELEDVEACEEGGWWFTLFTRGIGFLTIVGVIFTAVAIVALVRGNNINTRDIGKIHDTMRDLFKVQDHKLPTLDAKLDRLEAALSVAEEKWSRSQTEINLRLVELSQSDEFKSRDELESELSRKSDEKLALIESRLSSQAEQQVTLTSLAERADGSIAVLKSKIDTQDKQLFYLTARDDTVNENIAMVKSKLKSQAGNMASLTIYKEKADDKMDALESKLELQGEKMVSLASRADKVEEKMTSMENKLDSQAERLLSLKRHEDQIWEKVAVLESIHESQARKQIILANIEQEERERVALMDDKIRSQDRELASLRTDQGIMREKMVVIESRLESQATRTVSESKNEEEVGDDIQKVTGSKKVEHTDSPARSNFEYLPKEAESGIPEELKGPGACPSSQWIEIEGSCYFFGTDRQSQPAAREICLGKGAVLASVHSLAENQNIRKHLTYPETWIGLVRDGEGFAWLDGTPLDFTDWIEGEPNNLGGSENCVEITDRFGIWNDIDCDKKQGYICKLDKVVTPLHVAALDGDVPEILRLLGSGYEVNTKAYASNPHYLEATPLHLAAWKGHLEASSALLKRGADVALRLNDGRTALHVACKHGHDEVAKLLINHEADVDGTDNNGWTPMHWASFYNRVTVGKLLIKRGADVNRASVIGWTPLLLACKEGHFSLVELLIKGGAEINQANTAGKTPLHMACEKGHWWAVDLLIEHEADVNAAGGPDGDSPLHLAIRNGDIYGYIGKKLIASGADINSLNKKLYTPLYQAFLYGRDSISQLLIKHGADVNQANTDGKTLLHMACEKGHTSVVKQLIENEADVNKANVTGWTPLHLACDEGHFPMAKLLIDGEADVNQANTDGKTPLHMACEKGHYYVVMLLIYHGAYVNAAGGPDGDSPLHYAIRNGHMDIVKKLIASGADINMVNNKNYTCMYYTFMYGHDSMSQLLVEHGGDVNKAKSDGKTLMHIACEKGHWSVVKLLLEHGADVNATGGPDGDSPMNYAIKNGHMYIVKKLIESGADINAIDMRHKPPLYHTFLHGRDSMSQLLVEHGADVNRMMLPRYNIGYPAPLWFHAVWHGRVDTVRMLIDRGAVDVRRATPSGFTPLHYACMARHLDMVELLLERGANKKAKHVQEKTPLQMVNDDDPMKSAFIELFSRY